jgi:hypothetical protein
MDRAPRQTGAAGYVEALNNSDLANALRAGSAHFRWAEAKVIHDSSEKKPHG